MVRLLCSQRVVGSTVNRRVTMDMSTPNIKKILYNLASLSELGIHITFLKNLKTTFKYSLHLILGTISVPRGVIYYLDTTKNDGRRGLPVLVFKPLVQKGIDSKNKLTLRLDKSFSKKIIKTQKLIDLERREKSFEAFYNKNKKAFELIKAKIFLPLISKDKIIGALVIGRKLLNEKYRPDDYEIISLMGYYLTIGLQNHLLLRELKGKITEIQKLYSDMREIYYDTVKAFSAAIDAKDAYTRGHSLRVAKYASAIAKELGMKKIEIEGLFVAGLLHDIGKITIDSLLMNKPGKIDPEEMEIIKKHPVTGYEILSKIKFPWNGVHHIVRHHHERPNGTGYPDQLTSESLRTGAKILSLADAFDAMTTERPYRKQLPLKDTILEMKDQLGKQFDYEIAMTLFKVLQKELAEGKGTELDKATFLSNIDEKIDLQVIKELLEAILYELS